MRPFAVIEEIAAERKGGAGELAKRLQTPKTPDEIRAIPPDRWLAAMTKRVFQAGFNWWVIDHKWDGFEAAFEGFDPGRWVMMTDDDLDRLLTDTRIVRHGRKIRSVRENAVFLAEINRQHGSVAGFFADWPDDDYVGLLEVLAKRASRMGGRSGQYVLRRMGKDSFITSRDVCRALVREGVVDREPASKREMQAIQGAFNEWRAESGRPLTQISQILAMSVGD